MIAGHPLHEGGSCPYANLGGARCDSGVCPYVMEGRVTGDGGACPYVKAS